MKKKTLTLLVSSLLLAHSTIASAIADRTVAYMTSWGLNDSAVASLEKSEIDTFLLSFAKWDKDGNISSSDNIATAPEYSPWWMDTGYITWTQLKKSQPHKKMMVAFGGQTYEEMWSYIETPEQREKVVTNLVKLLNTPFPVYKKNLKPGEMLGECLNYTWDKSACDMTTYQLAGHVYLDGIDFDFEKSSRLTEQENENLLLVARELRNRVGDSKLISLTTYHVGADPVECADNTVFENCSYTEDQRSSHHGEVLSLLTRSRDDFDFFNVMAYDAGKRFDYRMALANYKFAVGDAKKILLGNTINSQWGPESNFVETRENNLMRSKWQAVQGYGGFFVWAIGANTENLSVAEQVDYINDMNKEAESADRFEWSQVINDLQVRAGKITVTMRKDIFDDNYRIVLKHNDSFIAETYAGKAYHAVTETAPEGSISFSTMAELEEGDIVTLEYHAGLPQTSVNGTMLKKLSEVNITEAMAAPAGVRLSSVEVTANKIKMTLPKDIYSANNRIIVRLNGKYQGETYAGKSYYSSSAIAPSGDIVVTVNTAIKKGDEVRIIHTAGVPGGSAAEIFKTLYQQKVTF